MTLAASTCREHPGGSSAATPSRAESRRMPESRKTPSTPKPVRHRRWKRLAFGVTLAGIVGFALLSVSFFGGGDPERDATWTVLEEIARAVERYRVEHREMPADLGVIWGPTSDIVG